jgi:hypothetical protein
VSGLKLELDTESTLSVSIYDDAGSTTGWITTQSSPGRCHTAATETRVLPQNENAGSEWLSVVPLLPKGRQSDKHLYGTNSSAARLA